MDEGNPRFKHALRARTRHILDAPPEKLAAIIEAAVARSLRDGESGATADVKSANALRSAIAEVTTDQGL